MNSARRKCKRQEALLNVATDLVKGLSSSAIVSHNLAPGDHIISATLDKLITVSRSSAAFIYEIVSPTGQPIKLASVARKINDNSVSPEQIEKMTIRMLTDPEKSYPCQNTSFSFTGLPLIYDGRTIGALAFVKMKRRFRNSDLQSLEPIVACLRAYIGTRRKERSRLRTEKRMRELHQALSQFRFALHSTSIVSITDTKGIIKYANRRFSDISKYSYRELIGRKHSIVNSGHFPREFWKGMWKTISRGEIWRNEIKNRAKDGTYYWVDTFIVPLKDTTGKVTEFISIRYDITERKKDEDKLNALTSVAQEARKKAEEFDQLKSAFISNLSHEIRTPMNAIMGISELLEKDNLSESTKRQYTKLIRQRSNDLLTIVNNILHMAQIESGKVNPTEEHGNIKTFLEELLVSIRDEMRLRKKSILIEMYCRVAKEDENIIADFTHLREVLEHLLANAVKFTDSSGIIKFGCDRQDPQTLRFSVRDTGRGISPEKQEVIFKPFRQADVTIHQYFGGTGLGLAIAKGYVERWGGRIGVQSDDGGSVFFFTMPFKQAPAP